MTKSHGKKDSRHWLSFFGCSCHNDKRKRRKARKSDKQAERRAWKKDQTG